MLCGVKTDSLARVERRGINSLSAKEKKGNKKRKNASSSRPRRKKAMRN